MHSIFLRNACLITLAQRLGSVPVAGIVTNALTDSGSLVSQALDVREGPGNKLLNGDLMRIVFKRDVARKTSIVCDTVEEVGLFLGKVIQLPIIGIDIPDNHFREEQDELS